MLHVKVYGWDTTTGNVVTLPTGTNTIGNVGLVAGTATVGNVGIVAGTATMGNVGVIAGTANIGTLYNTEQADVLRFGTVATTAQYVSVALTSSAANAILVTSVSAKRLVLLSAALGGSPAMTVQFFSATTAISGPVSIAAGGAITLPLNKAGWFVGNAGESLTVTPSVSGNLGGMVTFIVV